MGRSCQYWFYKVNNDLENLRMTRIENVDNREFWRELVEAAKKLVNAKKKK